MQHLLLFKFCCVTTSVLSSANETSFSSTSSFELFVNIFSFFLAFLAFYLFDILIVTELDNMGSGFCPELKILFEERRLLTLHHVGSALPWNGFHCWL